MVQWGVLGQWDRQQRKISCSFFTVCSGKVCGKDDYIVAGCIQQYFDLEGLSVQVLYYLCPCQSFNVPLIGKPSQWTAVGWSDTSLAFWSQADISTWGHVHADSRSLWVFLTLNLLLSHCESSGLADLSSQFNSWGWDRIPCLWLIHLKCGNVSSAFPKQKLALYSLWITLLLIQT